MTYAKNLKMVAEEHGLESANLDRMPSIRRTRKSWTVFQSLDTMDGLKEVDRLLQKCKEVELYA